jgi:copper homeostasis protein (lipoprotein)
MNPDSQIPDTGTIHAIDTSGTVSDTLTHGDTSRSVSDSLIHADTSRTVADPSRGEIPRNSLQPDINVLTGTRWELSEIWGQPVRMKTPDENIPWFILRQEENRITGFGGCNNFSGTYELPDGGGIRFSPIVATKMACPHLDMNYEPMVFEVFEKADTYRISRNMLILSRGEEAPMGVWIKGN